MFTQDTVRRANKLSVGDIIKIEGVMHVIVAVKPDGKTKTAITYTLIEEISHWKFHRLNNELLVMLWKFQ